MKATASLTQRYESALTAEARVRDPAQIEVVQRLEQLTAALRSEVEPDAIRRWFTVLRGKPVYPQTNRGIYLWGAVGRGKTWLMDLFCAEFPGQRCRRLHFQHFMRDIHARLARLRRRERPLDAVAAQLAQEARLYCLDEFMVQDIGDAMILQGLLEGMLRRGVVLFMTSNTPPRQLYKDGLQRERFLPAIALLERYLDVMEIGSGADFRMRQLQTTPTWLPAFNSASTTRMQTLFERLAGGAGIDTAAALQIEDRPIQTRCHAGAMAWFEFSALCDGPRSANDYIALAGQLHTVFLSDVPVFDGHNDDAARRFIALIDELYDQGVKLVISAAAEPGELYRGDRLAQAFQRTASRLIEMRAAEYLARTRPVGRNAATEPAPGPRP